MSRLTLIERTKLNLGDVAVLVVGGASMAVDLITCILSGFGANQLRRAESHAEAQQICRNSPIDLLVIDSTLGQEASDQLARWVRRQPGDNRLCPILLIAANPRPDGVGTARDSGVSYTIAKPVTPKVVFERLVWVVREKKSFIENDRYAGPDRRWRRLGPPLGGDGRRSDDLDAELGPAAGPNLSQSDLDALITPVRRQL